MNENINLVEILEGCEGMEFYSTIFGVVKLHEINNDNEYQIDFGIDSVDSQGKHNAFYDGECTFFPSKDQRDWSKFVKPVRFEKGEIVLVSDSLDVYPNIRIFDRYDKEDGFICFFNKELTNKTSWEYCYKFSDLEKIINELKSK